MPKSKKILRPGHIEAKHLEDKHLLFDCDGVLLDYVAEFGAFCRAMGHRTDGPAPRQYNMADWLGVDDETLLELIGEFNEEQDDFRRIPTFEHATAGVRMLADLGFEITIVTSATNNPRRQQMRLENLEFHFGRDAFKDVFFLGTGVSKQEVLAAFDPTLWVEDSYKYALEGRDNGHLPVMKLAPHNTREFEEIHNDGITWVNDIDEIATAVEKAMHVHRTQAA